MPIRSMSGLIMQKKDEAKPLPDDVVYSDSLARLSGLKIKKRKKSFTNKGDGSLYFSPYPISSQNEENRPLIQVQVENDAARYLGRAQRPGPVGHPSCYGTESDAKTMAGARE